MITLAIVQWAAEECQRQHSGELSVARMVEAWEQAVTAYESDLVPAGAVLRGIAAIIEPRLNCNGYRQVRVTVGGSVPMHPSAVPSAMANLSEAMGRLTPTEAYKEFEEIHPFIDGNGRTGSILYNWLSGTLLEPIAPPDLWRDSHDHTHT